MAKPFKTPDGLEIEELEDRGAPSQGASDDADAGPSPIDDNETVGDLADSEPALKGPGAEYQPEAPHVLAKMLPPVKDPTASSPDITDKLASTQAAPDSSGQGASGIPSGFDISKLMTTPDDLKKVMADKRNHAILGGIIDNLSNRQSAGNFMLGRMSPKESSAGLVQALDAQSDLPIQQKQAQLAQVTKAPQVQEMMDAVNPSSSYSQSKIAEAKATFGALVKAKLIDQDTADQLTGGLDKMNGYQVSNLMANNPLLKTASDAIRAQAMIAMAGRKADQTDTRIGIQKDNQASKAGDDIDNDSIIKTATTSKNSLDRALSILKNSSKPVTTKDLNLAYNDYMNAVAAGGQATEGKIHRELPDTFEQTLNDLHARFGDFDDLRQSGTGAKLVDMLTKNIATVQGDLQGAIADRTKRKGSNYSQTSNPKVKAIIDQKVQSNQPQESGQGAPQGNAPKRALSQDDLNDYAKTHGMNPNAAAMWLRSQGYVINQ